MAQYISRKFCKYFANLRAHWTGYTGSMVNRRVLGTGEISLINLPKANVNIVEAVIDDVSYITYHCGGRRLSDNPFLMLPTSDLEVRFFRSFLLLCCNPWLLVANEDLPMVPARSALVRVKKHTEALETRLRRKGLKGKGRKRSLDGKGRKDNCKYLSGGVRNIKIDTLIR